jgi:hypothetical protein
MTRLILALVLITLLTTAQPGFARDPYRDEDLAGPGPASWSPEPAPVAPPPGIYLVTDTYAGDSVTRSGPLTTYTTETVHETTGSYARVLESVATGGSSAYDGAAFNGRAALTDGRSVAGTYYENYIWTEFGFVPISVVFFQDDSEIAREQSRARADPSPVVAAQRSPAPTSGPAPASGPGPAATAGTAPPVRGDPPAPAPAPTPSPVRPSVLLPDRSIEVLRGRRTTISFLGDDVRSWRFLSGEGVALGVLGGMAADSFIARWDVLAPAGATWVVRFLVGYEDGTTHERVLRVTVRAPGLVE